MQVRILQSAHSLACGRSDRTAFRRGQALLQSCLRVKGIDHEIVRRRCSGSHPPCDVHRGRSERAWKSEGRASDLQPALPALSW